MQIVCPNCEARYLAPDEQIGPTGRRVRCVKCAHIWRSPPPPPKGDSEGAEAVSPEPDRTVRIDPLPRNRIPAPATQQPRRRRSAVGWAFFLMVVAAVAAAFYFGRAQVLQAWPASAKLYTAVGLPIETTATAEKPALKVSSLENAWVEADGKTELVLKGVVKNETEETAPAPFVRIRLYDKQGGIVRDQREILPGGELKPGESRGFAMRFDDPGDVARAQPLLEPVQ